MINDMYGLSKLQNAVSRSISAENFTGAPGAGGQATEGTGSWASRDLGKGWKVSPSVHLEPGAVFELANIQGPGEIRHIWMGIGAPNRSLILRIYWEGCETPSVETPLGDFFANADTHQYGQISSLAVCINPLSGLNCYWNMPFYKNCRITVENVCAEKVVVFYQIDYVLRELEAGLGYFHAQYRRSNPLKYKADHVILDQINGHGQYVGTYMFWGSNNNEWWGEGEIKFFMDGDKDYPTICGTGTEDYFCGAYGFEVNHSYQTFTSPYAGMSKIMDKDGLYSCQQRFSMYRWHVTDPIYFKEDLRVTIQALGWRRGGRYLPLQDDISSVAYWDLDTPIASGSILGSEDDLEII